MMWLHSFISALAFFAIQRVGGTLIPGGSVSIDCGGQRTFTCTVTGQAAWTVTGLMGITAAGSTAGGVAAASARVTTTDTGLGTTSTIIITGFNTNDNGGTVQCVDIGIVVPSVEGVATIAVGPPSCPANVASVAHDDNDAVTVTWSLPPTSPPVTSTTVTYCPTSSPNCGDSQVCTSPCTVTNLEPDTEYSFTVTAITSSNCGIGSCNWTTITAETACPVASASTSPAILSGVIPSVVLILINIISVAVVFLVTRHCYKKSAKGGSSSRREELYEQVERKKMHEDINMTDSPAYGPVI